MVDDNNKKILLVLAEQGLIKGESQISDITQQLDGGVTLDQILVETDLVEPEALAKVRAQVAGLPYVDLREKQISKNVLDIIPESTARGHMIIAYEQTDDVVRVAMSDPSDRQIVEFIRKKVDRPVEVGVASAGAVRNTLGNYQESLEAELDDVVSKELKLVNEIADDLGKAAEDLPIVRITQAILKHAIVEGASDIHIEPTDKDVIIRYRVDGILHDMLVLPRAVLAGLVARIKVLSNLKIDEHRLPQDGRFMIESDEYKVAFRVSTLPVFDGEKVVMRLLDESGKKLSLDDIGIRPAALELMRRIIKRPHGMVLVTGPTGSGKTTTLYAAMKEVNTADVNISTIEDPVEYRMPRINQTQVKPQIGLTFANGLRALVRQDPDVIMVGEIRDEETASLAINAALTGHLVLTTLHTNSAAGAIPRMRDMKVEAFLLASTVNLIMAQRLVRKLCVKCRKERKLDAQIIGEIKKEFNSEEIFKTLVKEKVVKEGSDWKDVVIYQAVGCKRCHDGYKGRIGIYETMEITPEIQKMIKPSVTAEQIEQAARENDGMVSMLEDGIIKTVEGTTTLEEVLRVARE
jgi:type IV pilus assembly protein PilB